MKKTTEIAKKIGIADITAYCAALVMLILLFRLYYFALVYAFGVIIPVKDVGYIGVFAVYLCGAVIGTVLVVISLMLLINRVTDGLTAHRLERESYSESAIHPYFNAIMIERAVKKAVKGVAWGVIAAAVIIESFITQIVSLPLTALSVAFFVVFSATCVWNYGASRKRFSQWLTKEYNKFELSLICAVNTTKLRSKAVSEHLIRAYSADVGKANGSVWAKSFVVVEYAVYLCAALIASKACAITVSECAVYLCVSGLQMVFGVILFASVTDMSFAIEVFRGNVNDRIVGNSSSEKAPFRFDSVLEVRNLCYSYGKNNVIRDLNFTLNAGESLAVSGAGSSGKTTLAKLLCGQIKADRGTVYYDDAEIKEVDLKDLYTKTCIINQDDGFFNGTLRDNLVSRAVDDDQISAVLNKMGLTSFIASLPDGIDTEYYHGSLTFGEGVMQKLVLCRALLRVSDLYILDDIFRFVDRKAKITFMKELLSLHKSYIIITNDKSIVEVCDKVLWLR